MNYSRGDFNSTRKAAALNPEGVYFINLITSKLDFKPMMVDRHGRKIELHVHYLKHETAGGTDVASVSGEEFKRKMNEELARILPPRAPTQRETRRLEIRRRL